ncbi:hypothetical protein pb186bvf_019797 [Paramecium bursaria]
MGNKCCQTQEFSQEPIVKPVIRNSFYQKSLFQQYDDFQSKPFQRYECELNSGTSSTNFASREQFVCTPKNKNQGHNSLGKIE